jgi:ABC-type glutathione transport system ATPase component
MQIFMGISINILGIFLHMEIFPYLVARYQEGKKRKDREKRKAERRRRKQMEKDGIVPAGYWDEQNKLDNLETESVVSILDIEDEDVINERERIIDQECDDDYEYNDDDPDAECVRIMDLKKTFRDGKKAVNNVTFGVKNNMLFGLLGPNGAGKTTVINMVCGIHGLTEGKIEVCGIDLTHSKNTKGKLGVCPQFDCVWDELTVREHLLLYATIKGMKPWKRSMAVVVRNVAEMVNLDGDPFNKPAS